MQGPKWTHQEMEDAMEVCLRSGDIREVTDTFSFLLSEGQTYSQSEQGRWAIDAALRLVVDQRVLSAPDLGPLVAELLGLWPSLSQVIQCRIVDEVISRAEYTNADGLYWIIEKSVGRGVSAREAARHLASMLTSPVESIRQSAVCALKRRLEDFNRADAADLQLGTLLIGVLDDQSARVQRKAEEIRAWCHEKSVPLGGSLPK